MRDIHQLWSEDIQYSHASPPETLNSFTMYLKFSEQDQPEHFCEQYMVKDCKEGA